MDYVLKKTYLGLALEEVLQENGLTHMSKEIGEVFKEAFMLNFKKLGGQGQPIKITGMVQTLKQSPIGKDNQYSCLNVVATDTNYRGRIEFLNRKVGATTCIQVFSDNKDCSKKKIVKTKRSLKHYNPQRRRKGRSSSQEQQQ